VCGLIDCLVFDGRQASELALASSAVVVGALNPRDDCSRTRCQRRTAAAARICSLTPPGSSTTAETGVAVMDLRIPVTCPPSRAGRPERGLLGTSRSTRAIVHPDSTGSAAATVNRSCQARTQQSGSVAACLTAEPWLSVPVVGSRQVGWRRDRRGAQCGVCALLASELECQAGDDERREKERQKPLAGAPEGDDFALGRVEGLSSA
jgi:hypothetical protein